MGFIVYIKDVDPDLNCNVNYANCLIMYKYKSEAC